MDWVNIVFIEFICMKVSRFEVMIYGLEFIIILIKMKEDQYMLSYLVKFKLNYIFMEVIKNYLLMINNLFELF